MSPWCFMLWRRLEESYFQDAQHDAESVLEQVSFVKAEAEGGGEGKVFFRGGELQTEAELGFADGIACFVLKRGTVATVVQGVAAQQFVLNIQQRQGSAQPEMVGKNTVVVGAADDAVGGWGRRDKGETDDLSVKTPAGWIAAIIEIVIGTS